jgi:hypothetical protein
MGVPTGKKMAFVEQAVRDAFAPLALLKSTRVEKMDKEQH